MTGNVIKSLCDLALKAVQKAFNALSAANKQLTQKVKILSRKKADGPVFSVDVIKSDEKYKHYTGFRNYAVFVSVLNLLQPGNNGENIRLVSAPNPRPETRHGHKCSCTGEPQFLLTLMRIRRGFSTVHQDGFLELTRVPSVDSSLAGLTSPIFVCQQFLFGQQENRSMQLCHRVSKKGCSCFKCKLLPTICR